MPEIKIYGIEAGNITDFRETLTPEVERSLAVVVKKIRKELEENGST
jgi:Ni,Fe-hydrogenase maturation factor